jgi:hypothetical protein
MTQEQPHSMTVEYVPLTADQVKRLQQEITENRVWEALNWGSHGPEGKGPKRTRVLAELDTDHLEAILITQPHIGNSYRAAILALLKERYIEQHRKDLGPQDDAVDEGP